FLGLTPMAWLKREKRFAVGKPVGLWGAYLMGFAFAFGWTPCIGPILAAVLALAAAEATVLKGVGLLAVYSLGLGVPFVIAAIAVEPFAAFLARFRAHLGLVEKAMGGLLVLTGIAFLTGAMSEMSYWLLDTLPVLGTIGHLSWDAVAKKKARLDEAGFLFLAVRWLHSASRCGTFDIVDLAARILLPDVHHVVELGDVAFFVIGHIT